MDDLLTRDFPADTLEVCIEGFWAKNPELKRQVLRDWYNGGFVGQEANLAGLKAVSKWLSGPSLSNGDRA
jgi:hypothetical protein